MSESHSAWDAEVAALKTEVAALKAEVAALKAKERRFDCGSAANVKPSPYPYPRG